MQGTAKLLPTNNAKMVIDSYVSVENSIKRVSRIYRNTVYFTDGTSAIKKQCKLMKIYVINDSNHVLGELEYKNYDIAPGSKISGTIKVSKIKAHIGETVLISSIPLHQFKEEFDEYFNNKPLYGKIINIKDGNCIIKTDAGTCILHRRSFCLIDRDDTFNIFKLDETNRKTSSS